MRIITPPSHHGFNPQHRDPPFIHNGDKVQTEKKIKRFAFRVGFRGTTIIGRQSFRCPTLRREERNLQGEGRIILEKTRSVTVSTPTGKKCYLSAKHFLPPPSPPPSPPQFVLSAQRLLTRPDLRPCPRGQTSASRPFIMEQPSRGGGEAGRP